MLQALFRAMDEREEGFITVEQFQKWVAASGSGQIRQSESVNSGGKGAKKLVAQHKQDRNLSIHFFRKHGLDQMGRTLDFEEFTALAAEFWDESNHYRMIKLGSKKNAGTKKNSINF